MKMKIGDFAFVEYNNGKLYTGEVVGVKDMSENRTLFTVNDPVGFKSLYLDKCVSVEVWEASK
jgi:hypothetical protein